MHLLTIGMHVAFFGAIGALFWAVADEPGLFLWVIFGAGAYSLGRWYQYEHATGPPWGREPTPSPDG